MKRQGRVWIRIFPDVPVSKKPAEVRQGKGKGAIEYWAARVKPGRILFELDGVPGPLAAEAFERAAMKLPIKTKVSLAWATPRTWGNDGRRTQQGRGRQLARSAGAARTNERLTCASGARRPAPNVPHASRKCAAHRPIKTLQTPGASRPRRKETRCPSDPRRDRGFPTRPTRPSRAGRAPVKHPMYGKIIRRSKVSRPRQDNAFKTAKGADQRDRRCRSQTGRSSPRQAGKTAAVEAASELDFGTAGLVSASH
jgi:hypothetical protein